MIDDSLWYAFAGLFALTGLIHFVRALKKVEGRRNAGFAMAGASVLWGATALTLRFAGLYPAALAALSAVGCMLLAAVLSGRIR